jgi:hypothetical protein
MISVSPPPKINFPDTKEVGRTGLPPSYPQNEVGGSLLLTALSLTRTNAPFAPTTGEQATTPAPSICVLPEQIDDNDDAPPSSIKMVVVMLDSADDITATEMRGNIVQIDGDIGNGSEEMREPTAAPRAMVETTNEDAAPAPFNSIDFDACNEEKWAVVLGARAMVTTDDEDAPAPFNSMEFDSGNEEIWAAAAAARAMVETTDGVVPLAHFNSMEFEDNEGDSVTRNAMQRTNTSNKDSTMVPPCGETKHDERAEVLTHLGTNLILQSNSGVNGDTNFEGWLGDSAQSRSSLMYTDADVDEPEETVCNSRQTAVATVTQPILERQPTFLVQQSW